MPESLAEVIEKTRAICQCELQRPPLLSAWQFLARNGVTEAIGLEILRACAQTEKPNLKLLALLKASAQDSALASQPGLLERSLLVQASLRALAKIEELPVYPPVKYLYFQEFVRWAEESTHSDSFAQGTHPFRAMCKLALLMRFPGGQLHWEVSSFRKRWFLRMDPATLRRALAFFTTKTRAFQPYFVWHLGHTTKKVPFLLEREAFKTFYRMAATLEQQPSIRALMGLSWLHSEETHRVSPHLAFLNRPFTECGGIYLDLGFPKPSSGFLEGDTHRAQLYKSGEYRPTIGAVICSRDQAISWKRAHPEFEQLASSYGSVLA